MDYGGIKNKRADNRGKQLNGICSIHFTFHITATYRKHKDKGIFCLKAFLR